MYIEAFTTHFGELSDNRQLAKVTYPLEDILFITLCKMLRSSYQRGDRQSTIHMVNAFACANKQQFLSLFSYLMSRAP